MIAFKDYIYFYDQLVESRGVEPMCRSGRASRVTFFTQTYT